MRNGKAVLSVLFGLVALGAMLGTAAAARLSEHVGLWEGVAAVPVGALLGILAIRFGRAGYERHQRTLGRAGGRVFSALGRGLGTLALLVALTAALALGVFAVLAVVLD
jgi:hypothetical protein